MTEVCIRRSKILHPYNYTCTAHQGESNQREEIKEERKDIVTGDELPGRDSADATHII